MIHVRPALVQSAAHTRYIEALGWNGLVQRESPTVVSSTFRSADSCEDEKDEAAGTNATQDIYFRFAFPIQNPLLSHGISPLLGTTQCLAQAAPFTSPADAVVSGTVELFAMLEDWDRATLCWNNKPEPDPANLLASRTLTSIPIGNLGSGFEGYESVESLTLDARALGLVYGLCMRCRLTSTPAADQIHLVRRTGSVALTTTAAKRTATITRRSSSGLVRTLIFADGHGLDAEMASALDGLPFKVLSVDGADAEKYNTTNPDGSTYFRPQTIADANTLTYVAASLLTEAETDSEGRIEYW